MKDGWKYIDFKDVFPVKMGKTPPRGDKASWDVNKETQNKWVSIADISSNEGKVIQDTKEYISDSAAKKIFKVAKGSLLMSFKLSIGRMAFAGDDLYTNEAIIAIPESDKYLLRFLFYYLSSYDWLSLTEGNEKVKGATLNKTSIGTIQLPALSLSEQQSIVDYLDSSFAKIDAMKANAEKALGEAKALFQSSLKFLLEPKDGWTEKKVGDIAEIKGGKRLPKGQKLLSEPTNHKYIRVADFNDLGSVDLDDIQYISDEVYSQIKRYIINKEDIYISIAGTIGKSGIIPDELDGANLTENACRLILSDVVNQKFMYYLTISPEFVRQELSSTKTSAQPKLALTRLAEIVVAFPSLTEQENIAKTLDAIQSKADQLQANFDKITEECDALKQAILKQVFE